jgi:16S rRNA (guanine527-N7)-methyltransferase
MEAWFGLATPLADRFAQIVSTTGVDHGLLGPREVTRLWNRHIMNCVVIHPLIPHGCSVADIGSGAGFPGIPVALARPDLHVTLVEPLLRRATFLAQIIETLELSNVTVVRSRAEDLVTGAFDVVTARAVAPLERLLRWTLPLCRPDGEVLAIKGATASDELARAAAALRRLGVHASAVEQCGEGVVEPATTVVRLSSRRPS